MGIFPLRGKVILVSSRKGPATVLTSSRSYSVFDMLSSSPEKRHEISSALDSICKITIHKLSPNIDTQIYIQEIGGSLYKPRNSSHRFNKTDFPCYGQPFPAVPGNICDTLTVHIKIKLQVV